jgi:2-keto-4-pentenoate hydratase/2-oxohepta-3-ene-1,7-dioic acid hydratase in catechol pathway
MTLNPGDVVATGTPQGVGFKRTPPRYLRPGDLVEVEIDRIGAVAYPIVGTELSAQQGPASNTLRR